MSPKSDPVMLCYVYIFKPGVFVCVCVFVCLRVCVCAHLSCSYIRREGEHAGGGRTHHRGSLQAAESEQPYKRSAEQVGWMQTVSCPVLLVSSGLCCGPVPQVRIEQVIVAEPGAVLLYKLSNLLKFYHHTIRYFRREKEFDWLIDWRLYFEHVKCNKTVIPKKKVIEQSWKKKS